MPASTAIPRRRARRSTRRATRRLCVVGHRAHGHSRRLRPLLVARADSRRRRIRDRRARLLRVDDLSGEHGRQPHACRLDLGSVPERHHAAARQLARLADRRRRRHRLRRRELEARVRAAVLVRPAAGVAGPDDGRDRLPRQPLGAAEHGRHERRHGQHQSARSGIPRDGDRAPAARSRIRSSGSPSSAT